MHVKKILLAFASLWVAQVAHAESSPLQKLLRSSALSSKNPSSVGKLAHVDPKSDYGRVFAKQSGGVLLLEWLGEPPGFKCKRGTFSGAKDFTVASRDCFLLNERLSLEVYLPVPRAVEAARFKLITPMRDLEPPYLPKFESEERITLPDKSEARIFAKSDGTCSLLLPFEREGRIYISVGSCGRMTLLVKLAEGLAVSDLNARINPKRNGAEQ